MKNKLLALISFLTIMMLGNIANAQISFIVEAPASIVGTYQFTYIRPSTGWGINMDTVAVSAQVVMVRDANPADSCGCGPLVNAAAVAGKIAAVYRGPLQPAGAACEFGVKVKNAQDAGAIGVIVINHSGAPMGMSGGAQGSNVIIPAIMISTSDGALFNSHIAAGDMVAFIGNRSGLYANDLGLVDENILKSDPAAIPSFLAQDSADFNVKLGAWIYNYGFEDQTNVSLTAEVTFGGNVIYSQTSNAVNMTSGDSAYFALPLFYQSSYNEGHYQYVYTINSDSVEGFPLDNSYSGSFSITENEYSLSRINADNTYVRSGNATPGYGDEWTWCVPLLLKNNSKAQINGISFAASKPVGQSLEGEFLEAQIYTAAPNLTGLDNLTMLLQYEFDFFDDSQNEFVYIPFGKGVEMSNNYKYLVCMKVYGDSVQLAYDRIGYDLNYDMFTSPSAPLQAVDGGSPVWYLRGFSDAVPAFIIDLAPLAVGVEEKTTSEEAKPFPNPASQFINIPLANIPNGNVEVQIFDLNGRIVKTEMVNISNTSVLQVNTTDISTGTYIFNLKYSDNKVSSFPVVISK
jgi:hypothetical protein